ncbi:hypothetical protein AYO21_07499 [Fonsecaea monophora]|uniref:FAD dependent oxidoreductase domain-containing protein n=1 Tax=Fonsecaea monophora TaxID=254056 RepID=A0A177F1V7_9EURO|nr:hypothetical protein AYO21_07499 [Fonsecaea monophora]OAG38273.1 hypothetical protein AYO21_07499 [Fonsecaea monophora]
MKRPTETNRVAVIGAGISGVATAAHLLKHGLEVTVFERSSTSGGVWHFDERSAPDPPFPNLKPSDGDSLFGPQSTDVAATSEEVDQGHNAALGEISHAPPGPCYAGLMNNIPIPLMQTSLMSYPAGTSDHLSHDVVERHIHDISRATGVDKVIQNNTRVLDVRKQGSSWVLQTTALWKESDRVRFTDATYNFDAVVIASGHYSMPRVPDIPGLSTWKRLWPDRVWHSKRYRRPAAFKDKTILLIGAGVSSSDIAKEAAPIAKKIYQSSRGGVLDLPTSFLPEGTLRIGGIQSFELPSADFQPSQEGPIPLAVTLTDGTRLQGIDIVVVATGYIISYPFLRHLHSDTTAAANASREMLVTAEGDMVHNLWQDIFYIPDPTMAFVGTPLQVTTFCLFDFQAQVVARVFAGKAYLPAQDVMRKEYEDRLAQRGTGRDFHSLRKRGAEQDYVARLVEWMNKDAGVTGTEHMRGHTQEWIAAYESMQEKFAFLQVTEDKPQGESGAWTQTLSPVTQAQILSVS